MRSHPDSKVIPHLCSFLTESLFSLSSAPWILLNRRSCISSWATYMSTHHNAVFLGLLERNEILHGPLASVAPGRGTDVCPRTNWLTQLPQNLVRPLGIGLERHYQRETAKWVKIKSFSWRSLYEGTNSKLKYNCWIKILAHFAHQYTQLRDVVGDL